MADVMAGTKKGFVATRAYVLECQMLVLGYIGEKGTGVKMNPKGDNGKMTLAAHPVVTVVGSALTNAMDIFAINTQENVHRVDFLEPQSEPFQLKGE